HLNEADVGHFCSELGWREFSHHLLYYNPDLYKSPLQKKFENFPWKLDEDLQKAWQRGETGYPIIDAAMRELWETGYMHNRLRMVVASFLVKNLMQPWHVGLEWFRDCLVDASLANNSASWQWVAGCGADAAPFFRVFNPLTQSKKFDPDGNYIRKYLPQLATLPKSSIHMPDNMQTQHASLLTSDRGRDYPAPIVDLGETRKDALDAFKAL
ncbi:MAG: FAD-binding domain-containing protein, partial [Alphaproteobacteria bacterium]|nr:FAD-binding domain-containing protein [Alphaproteobacteria bacterium]